MITVKSYLGADSNLVPAEEFTGPIADEDYIEGAVELTIDDIAMLTRAQVDYVDQLWAYLVNGLDEVVAGRTFTTCFPDMPIEIALRPEGAHVTMSVTSKRSSATATTSLADLLAAMIPAARTFFARIGPLAPSNAPSYEYVLETLNKIEQKSQTRPNR